MLENAGRRFASVALATKAGQEREPNVRCIQKVSLSQTAHSNGFTVFEAFHHPKAESELGVGRHELPGDVALGDNMLFVNSSGDLSIAINQGNFANTYHIESGTDWTIEIEKQ